MNVSPDLHISQLFFSHESDIVRVMNFNIVSPTIALVEGATGDEIDSLTKQLSYINTAAQHQVKRHFANKWLRSKNPDGWKATLEELKNDVHHCLLFPTPFSDPTKPQKYIRPGSITHLDIDYSVTSSIVYPTPKKVAWAKPLPFELYDYQEISWQELLRVRHGNVELCTGSGKSAIILKICRETGFRTAIVAPSQPIFLELLEKFEHHFGRANVGAFGDGKKKLGKRFTICIDDSIANVKPGTEEWNFFSGLDMFCADESHTWGAETLTKICHGILKTVPYRFFFSGTQTRGDGAEKLLHSIIGPTVCTLTTEEAVRKGYICPHEYRIIEIESSDPNHTSADAIDMKRVHFLRNTNIRDFIAKFAAAEARLHRRQTLVLVDELSQVAGLSKLLEAAGIPTAVAHSEKNAKRLLEVGLPKVDRQDSIERFNKGEAMVLIGTACISTGTNIYPTHNTFNWQGGTSEIRTKQGAVGRSVRLGKANPWAAKCVAKLKSIIWDFKVLGIYIMEAHLDTRVEYYSESGSEVKYISLRR
jgi:superfamily II DNA or RNA helicase